MRKLLVVVSVFLAATTAAEAASHFKATMKSWKADALSAERMLADGKVDETEWRRIFSTYAKEAGDYAASLGAATPERRDMSARFAHFSADAEGLASAGREGKARFSNLRGECKSCHDAYAN